MPTNPQIRAEPVRHHGKSTYWVVGLASLTFLFVWLFPFQPVGTGLRGYAPLHSFLEIFAVVIAGVIFAVGWHARINREAEVLTMLAVGFLGVALLDTAHLLSFEQMPQWITPSDSSKAINFWFFARFLAAFTLLAFVLTSRRERKFHKGTEWFGLAAMLAFVAMATWVVLERPGSLPVFFIPGQGLTSAKVLTEWILTAIVLGTLALVWRSRDQARLFDPVSLMAALWMTCLGELCFTLYSDAADIFNLMGHVFKVLSYGFLYQAIVVGGVKLPYQLLFRNREILQQLTDNIPQVFWMLSPDGQKILYVSPAYESIWQRSCSDLLQNPIGMMDSIHPDDRERTSSVFAAMAHGETGIEYRIVRPDGSVRHIRTRSFPILDEQGDVMRIAGVSEDQTHEIQAQAAILQKDRLLRQTQSIAHLGSWEFDPTTNQFTCSDEVFRIFGLPVADQPVSYEEFLDYVHPQDRKYVDDGFRSSIASGQDHNKKAHRIIRKNNQEIRYLHEEYYHQRDASGNVVRTIGIVHDITEQKLAEREQENLFYQLVQAQKMEAIGHLTGGIAHDFNNMLGAILGFAYLLKQFDEKNIDFDEYLNYVEEISAAGNRAKELISQMLIFSRLKPEADGDEKTTVILKPVVQEVLQLLRQSIPSTIDIRSHVRDGDLSAVMHPVQLHQILMNLVINARDASTDGYGQIDIDAELRHYSGVCSACQQRIDGNYVVLTVSDTGEGIAEEILSRIFDPFFTTKEIGKGSGMGLSVVHGLVHSKGGHIVISPGVQGKGTTIEVMLSPPAADEVADEPVTTKNRDNEKTPLKGINVMVVDDELPNARMLQKLLELYGARVTTFNNPVEALSEFRNAPESFDLMVTDNSMPKLSGLDLSQEVLKLRPGLPIILCTGFSETINDEITRQYGIARLFYKPVPHKQFVEEIVTMMATTSRMH